ncbi:MAG: hypothetical protein ACOX3E_11510 [Desulfomonilia bacterium]
MVSKPSISGIWQSMSTRSNADLSQGADRIGAPFHRGHPVAQVVEHALRNHLVGAVVLHQQNVPAPGFCLVEGVAGDEIPRSLTRFASVW